MAHLWAIPLAIAAYAGARKKYTETAQFEEGIKRQLPSDYTLFVTELPERYLDTSPLLNEWEQGDTLLPYQKFRGVPWGVRQQMVREKFFAPKYFVNSHVRHQSRKFSGGPEWNFSQIV